MSLDNITIRRKDIRNAYMGKTITQRRQSRISHHTIIIDHLS